MKKLITAFAVLVTLLLAAVVIIPLVVDVDKYRPQIVDAANKQINGTLEMGKLKLSLWGQILIKIDGVTLTDRSQNKVISVREAFFHVPFTSLLSGSPLLTFKMDRPDLRVVKDKAGKLNLMSLVKASAEPTTAQGGTATAPTASSAVSSGSVQLPKMALAARFGAEIRNAALSYTDQTSGLESKVNDLNVILKDISLSRPTELEIWADLNTKMAAVFNLQGPFKIKGKLTPDFSGAEFQSALAKLNFDFDKLQIEVPGTFHKSASIPAHLDAELKVTKTSVTIQRANLVFHNLDLSIHGIANTPAQGVPSVKVDMASNDVDLSKWAELLPVLKGGDLTGLMSIKAMAEGPSDALKYDAEVLVKNLTASSPQLKHKPTIQARLKVLTNRIDPLQVQMTAPGNDLKFDLKLVDFAKPTVTASLTSESLDLDQLIHFPKPEPGAKSDGKQAGSGGSVAGGGSATPAEDFDAMLAPVRTNPAAQGAAAAFDIRMKRIKAYDIVISQLQSRMTFKNLKAAVEDFRLGVFAGTISAKMSADLAPKMPTYQLATEIKGLDLKQAVTSQLALLKNTVIGKLDFSMKGQGASFNPEPLKKHLDMKGQFKVADAVFTSIDIGKMTTEALNGSIAKLGDKYPKLKGKKLKGLPNGESKYEVVSASFSIAGGKFEMPNFLAKAYPNKGVDLEGQTRVGLIDRGLEARWKVIDRYNLTGAKDLGVDVAGTEVQHILASGNPSAVSFPVTVKGTMDNPQYSYEEVPEHFLKVALSNTTGAAKGRAQAELKKQAAPMIEQARQKAPEEVKKIFKKFGF